MDSLIELIFKGNMPEVNIDFLQILLQGNNDAYFNSPEIKVGETYGDVLTVFRTNDYVDFVITTNHFSVNERLVSNVFINIGLNNDELEVLVYFDAKDLGFLSLKENIDFLREWSASFKTKYSFLSVVCQFDNAEEDEYYFIDDELGSLYKKI